VLRDHAVDLAVPVEGELQGDPEAVQRRVPGADEPQPLGNAAQAAGVVAVLGGPEGDVVAEPLGLLVRVGVAADVDQQGCVVQRRALGVVEAQGVGQPQRDDALPEHVLHRLAEAQVHAQGQRRHELGEAQLAAGGVRRADRRHGFPLGRDAGCAVLRGPRAAGYARSGPVRCPAAPPGCA
jgi:hypothetical protein